jgi:hypothetical protein
MQTRAAVKIQRWYRAKLSRRKAREWRRRMSVVLRVLRRYVTRWRLRRKNRAADVVRRFLMDVQEVTRVSRAIRRFRFCVTQTQLLWRRFEEVQQAQLQLLLRQWQHAEALRVRNTWERTAQAQQPTTTTSLLWGHRKPVTHAQSSLVVPPSSTLLSSVPQRKSSRTLLSRGAAAGSFRKSALQPVSILEDGAKKIPEAIKIRLLQQVLAQNRRAYILE